MHWLSLEIVWIRAQKYPKHDGELLTYTQAHAHERTETHTHTHAHNIQQKKEKEVPFCGHNKIRSIMMYLPFHRRTSYSQTERNVIFLNVGNAMKYIFFKSLLRNREISCVHRRTTCCASTLYFFPFLKY